MNSNYTSRKSQKKLKEYNSAQKYELLTRVELSNRWKLSVQTLKRWEKNGELPFMKLGKQVRYDPNIIENIEQSFKMNAFMN